LHSKKDDSSLIYRKTKLMYKPVADRYKKINGKDTIEIRVNSVLQLFDARDPAPFRDRDIDDDFAEYIVSSTEELAYKKPLRISVLIAQKSEIATDAIVEAIRTYFQYQVELERLKLSKSRRMARTFLFVGIFILMACLLASKSLESANISFLSQAMREGIVIFGWVSLWRPIELLLFDWYPIYDRIRNFRRIVDSEIQAVFDVNA